MRQIEKERLKQLIIKRESGAELTDAEKARLIKLESQELRERRAEHDGRGIKSIGGTTPGNGDGSTSGGDTSGSGEGLRESESDEQRDGSQLDSIVATDFRTANCGDGSSRTDSGNDGSPDSGSGESYSSGGGIDGSYIGETGGTTGQKRTRNSNRAKEKEGELVDLAPRDVKPKRQNKNVKASKDDITPADLYGAFICGTFQTVAFASGRPHWLISEEEALTIAKPLDQMLCKLNSKQKKVIEKYTTPAMLALAVAGVVVPRVMIDLSSSRRKPNVGNTEKITRSQQIHSTTGDEWNDDGGDAANVENGSSNADETIAGLFRTGN